MLEDWSHTVLNHATLYIGKVPFDTRGRMRGANSREPASTTSRFLSATSVTLSLPITQVLLPVDYIIQMSLHAPWRRNFEPTQTTYTVGWVCALQKEFVAAQAMLDEHHPSLPRQPNDHNAYILGRVGGVLTLERKIFSARLIAIELSSYQNRTSILQACAISDGETTTWTAMKVTCTAIPQPAPTLTILRGMDDGMLCNYLGTIAVGLQRLSMDLHGSMLTL